MLFWVSQQIIISLVVIILIHSIYTFLQNNLTTPKIRDMVNAPIKKYDEIYETIKQPERTNDSSSNMKNELQNYLKELSVSIKDDGPQAPNNKFLDNFEINKQD